MGGLPKMAPFTCYFVPGYRPGRVLVVGVEVGGLWRRMVLRLQVVMVEPQPFRLRQLKG